MSSRPPFGRLIAREKWGIALFVAVFLAFGALVLHRSAYLQLRMTDAGVYFRAGWAARSGVDPYTVQDDRGWTYLYPPTLALLMTPLADPPPGADRSWMLPYPVSVVVWYALSLVFLSVAVHWLAKAVEESSPDPRVRSIPAGSRRWWQHRLLPMLICLTAIGSTLSRGQVNTLLLMTLAGMIHCHVRAQGFRAGVWLAAATAIKIFPAYLLLYPLLSRDTRSIAGFLVGLAIFLFVLPAAVVGPAQAWEYNLAFLERMLLPHIGIGPEQEKVAELQRTMDNQSFMAVIHSTRNLEKVIADNVNAPTIAEQAAHVGIAVALTSATVLVWWPVRKAGKRPDVLFLGLLTCVMIASSAVCHLHYFILALPLVTVLLATGLERARSARLPWWTWALIALYIAGNSLPRLASMAVTRYLGLAMYLGMALWILGAVVMWRSGRPIPEDRAPDTTPDPARP